MRRMVSRQFNWIEIQLGCLELSKYISFYSAFWHNSPIETIDGYNERSTMDRFRISRDHPIVDGGSRCVA